MSSTNSYLVDQKLNKFHEMIEREKAEESFSSSLNTKASTQYSSNNKLFSSYNTDLSKYNNLSPTKQYSKMAPYSPNNDISISSLQSQKQSNSFLMGSQKRSKSPDFYSSRRNDSSDDLLIESTRGISKIQHHTRSSSSSRSQSPVSPRTSMTQNKITSNSPNNSGDHNPDQDDDRDLQISDLESSPKNATNHQSDLSNSPDHSVAQNSNVDYLNSNDKTSPLNTLKRGLSSIFKSKINKQNKEMSNYNYQNNQYQSSIRTITKSSPRSRSLVNTNNSSNNSPSFMSAREKFENSSWMRVPSRHSPNFILSDGSNDSPTQKVYNSRSSSPISSQNSPSFASKNNSNKYKSSTNNSYRSNSLKNEDNFFSIPPSPNRNSPIRSRSPPSPSYQIGRGKNLFLGDSDSDSDLTEEKAFNNNKFDNFSSLNATKPITTNSNSRYRVNNTKSIINDDSDSSSIEKDQKFNNFSFSSQRNDNFSLKFSSSQKPVISNYAEFNNDISSSSETDINYGPKYDEKGNLILPKAETKLTKKFSKQLSNLLSPANQRANGLLMISDSDSSTSSNFHPKPSPRSISTVNKNLYSNQQSFDNRNKSLNLNDDIQKKSTFSHLSSSSSSDSIFDMNRSNRSNLNDSHTSKNDLNYLNLSSNFQTNSSFNRKSNNNFIQNFESDSESNSNFVDSTSEDSTFAKYEDFSSSSSLNKNPFRNRNQFTNRNLNANNSKNYASQTYNFSSQKRNVNTIGSSGGYNKFNYNSSFTSNTPRINLSDSDSEDEFLTTLKKAIKENENVLKSVRH